MYLIIGLGNPGEQYNNTRHNVGFLVLDELHKLLEAPAWRVNKKNSVEISTAILDRQKIVLAKPTTFMNESGFAAKCLMIKMSQPKAGPPLAESVVVIHDDLDLPLGAIRISFASSAGGHNGVQSCIDHLGTKDFWRVRVGVAGEKRASTPAEVYVLKPFAKTEQPIITVTIKKAAESLLESLRHDKLTSRTITTRALRAND